MSRWPIRHAAPAPIPLVQSPVATEPETVHFGRKPEREWTDEARIAEPERYRLYYLALICCMTVGPIVLFAQWVTATITLPVAVKVAFLLALCAFFLLVTSWPGLSARWFRWSAQGRVPYFPDSRARLKCIGAPEDLAGIGLLEDVPFEPRIHFASFIVHPRPGHAAAFRGLLAVGFCALWIAYLFVRTGDWARGFNLCVWVSCAAAEMIVSWFCPTYIRVVPGRLDIIRYRALSKRVADAVHIDLRRARILVDVRKGYAKMSGEKRHVIPLFLVLGSRRFAYHLFLGALSSHTPPPMSDEELIG